MKTRYALALSVMLFASASQANNMHKFEYVDKNSDGFISRSEFLNHSEEKFNKMDANNDGKLTKEEKQTAKDDKKDDKKDND